MGKRKAVKAPVQVFQSTPPYSIGDPAFAEWLVTTGYSSVTMTEQKALGLTAIYRAQAIIAGTIAGLPLKVYRDLGDNRREVIPDHWLTRSPAGPYDISPFSWVEMLMLHMLNHGETFLKAIVANDSTLLGLWPIHPLAISKVVWDGPDKVFTIMLANGESEQRISGDITQVMGLTTDGLRGLSPLTLFRQMLNTSAAGETAAASHFTSGALFAGLVTTEEDVESTEAATIKAELNAKLLGTSAAGSIAFVNRALKFTPWTMTNADAQFIESRTFQVEEASRMYGVPAHLLSSTEKVTSWGTGISEQNLGLARYTLQGWTGRIESALRSLLPVGEFAEFEYKGLLAGTPKEEIELLLAQVAGGLLTADEARAILNLGPMPKQPEPAPTVADTVPVATNGRTADNAQN